MTKYQIGQWVKWQRGEDGGDGVIKRIRTEDGSVWYEIGWCCWVEESLIVEAK